MLQKPESINQIKNAKDLCAFGVEEIAYIKTIKSVEQGTLYAIHAADGTRLTVVTDRALAFATVSQHDMEPMSVH